MSDKNAQGQLPKLPAPFGTIEIYHDEGHVSSVDGYTADQMRGYAIDYELALARRASQVSAAAPADSAVLMALRDGIHLQEPVSIGKALRAQREARVSLSGGTGPVACAMMVNIQLTSWAEGPEKAVAYAKGFNDALKFYRNALLEVATEGQAQTSAAVDQKASFGKWAYETYTTNVRTKDNGDYADFHTAQMFAAWVESQRRTAQLADSTGGVKSCE